ncbi:hypothetical protein M409DRAFT_64403 [Zasmidium cellare ATCC 36951]|uniref:histidine kinase n=1 Tax=Zasmidium cellare ATCC 36951 TaxID=1080233 RepID=A0A6A6CV01_ZASCE|nr:uncharacterized protein M409DRAFT_64403 [Zasmidium cellare ATCC 36951]KAF2170020.1 hypothetical protein M409DRAFT_64403 [Zasmidium cellare ATCC 36951]
MRIPIRVQLGSLILLASLIGLAVISIAVWITTHNFVLRLRAERLAQTASLKAAQLASNLDVMQTSAGFVSSRVLIQNALKRYNDVGNNTSENWANSLADLQAAIGGESSQGQSLLLQARVYGKNATGVGGPYGLLNATAQNIMGEIPLPYQYPNGSQVTLGDDELGYPTQLYPNLTYSVAPNDVGVSVPEASYGNVVLQPGSPSTTFTLVLGPWPVNDTFSMVSLTMPIVNNTNTTDLLGWLTVAMDARLISAVIDSREGLGNTGETLILGPANSSNVFASSVMENAEHDQQQDLQVRYIVPLNDTYHSRHPNHVQGTPNAAFNSTEYPVINKALEAAARNASDNSGGTVKAKNEAKVPVSVGYALADTSIVNWVVIVELSRKEVWQPINQLRDVILACVFATAGLMAVIAYPLAHFASLPIVRLRQATIRSVEPPGSQSRSSFGSMMAPTNDGPNEEETVVMARKEGITFAHSITRWKQKRQESYNARREERRKRAFRIPAKVKERKYWIRDELSELTSTFNEMSDELMMQYSKLEDRVQQRTAELEQSKKAAEAANESKTLFIANISHELKTPLNGILGMCAVCMQEDDPIRLKRSLGIIYKSGDLLLNLLTDLLTFSKNQVGQSLSLDEREFRLRDISSQTLAIFDKQAKESNIKLKVDFDGINQFGNEDSKPERNEQGPPGTGRIRDMVLWGDVHRILQVVINLVSNALKFTPADGSVVLTIRCLPEIPDLGSRKSSFNSRQSRQRSSRHRASDGMSTISKIHTANAINAKDKPHALACVSASERASSPPPGRYVYFEFEVADTGPGIPDTLLDKIFEPFVQGDLSLSKKFGGTGLGLSICSQLANLMRGTMRVQSTLGLGSRFTMKIPLRHTQTRSDSSASSAVDRMDSISRTSSIDDIEGLLGHAPPEYDEKASTPPELHQPPRQAVNGSMGSDSQPRLVGLSQPFFAASQPMESPGSQPAAMQQIASQATRGARIRVLVAEDNKVNQEVVLRMLKLEDIYDVTIAKDGQEALDLVKESMRGDDPHPFNLIFMDVQMPNVDGLQSTKLIREIGYQAPIVALTAFAEESNVKDCLDSGMNYFLSKPIRRPQLKKVLKEYCAPIPEETEDATPPEERRGSGTNTTIVLNAQPAGTTAGPQLSTTSFENSARSSKPPSTNGDHRPVSPRCVA